MNKVSTLPPEKGSPTVSSTDLRAFSELLEKIYAGPLQAASVWDECLSSLRSHFFANAVVLCSYSPTPKRAKVLSLFGGGDFLESRERYNDYYSQFDPCFDLPFNKAGHVDELLGRSNWLRSPIFTEFCSQIDAYHILLVNVHATNDINCSLRICRPKSAPRFSSSEIERAELLGPHLKRSIHLHSSQDERITTSNLSNALVDRLMFGVVTLDQFGMILNSNSIADELLLRKDGLTVVSGKIRATLGHENQALQRLISEVQTGCNDGVYDAARAMSISRRGSICPLGLVVQSIRSNSWAEGQRKAAVAIVFRDPMKLIGASDSILRQIFNFTPAEARLAKQLAEGHTLEEVADTMDITRNTAKTHLKTIFAKTDLTRQADLIRVIYGSVAMVC